MVSFQKLFGCFPKNRDTPKWMVYNGNPYKNGLFGGTPIFGNTHINLRAVYGSSSRSVLTDDFLIGTGIGMVQDLKKNSSD